MLMHWAEKRCFCDDSPEQNHNFRWCHGQVVASQQDTSDLYEISEDYSSVADHLQNNLLISKILRVLLTTCYNMLQHVTTPAPGPKPPRPWVPQAIAKAPPLWRPCSYGSSPWVPHFHVCVPKFFKFLVTWKLWISNEIPMIQWLKIII